MTLVGYWPLTESSGDALDYSGNENHGTVNGSPQGYTGTTFLGNSVYDFDGSTSYINTNYPMNNVTSYSNSAWVNTNTTEKVQQVVHTAFTSPFSISINGDGDWRFTFNDGGSYQDIIETTNNPVGNWVHLAQVYDHTAGGWAYVNGQKVGSISNTGDPDEGGNPLFIGRQENNDAGHFDGQIAEVRHYNHALTPHEIQYLYQVSQQGHALTEEL